MKLLALARRGAAPMEFYRFQYVGTSTALAAWTSADVGVQIVIPAAMHPTGGLTLETFLPVPIKREQLASSNERAGPGLQVILPANDGETNAIVDLFRDREPPSPVELCLYLSYRGSSDTWRPFFGEVTSATVDRRRCVLNVEPKHGTLKRTILPVLVQAPCNNVLYDAHCGVNKAAFAWPATIDAIAADGVTLTIPEAADKADGYFGADGLLEFGNRVGTIVQHVGDQITLLRAVPGLLVGSDVTLFPGCKRDLGDCGDVFGNVANHMGFPFVPHVDPFRVGVRR